MDFMQFFSGKKQSQQQTLPPVDEGPGLDFNQFFPGSTPQGRPTAYGPNKPYTPPESKGSRRASVTPFAQSNEWSCGQASVAMTVNSLTGSDYKDNTLFESGDYSLISTLQAKTKGSGYNYRDAGNFTSAMWKDIDQRVNQDGSPVIIGLGGEFSPSGRGHIVTIVGTKGNEVSYADPADGTIKTTTRQRIENAPAHPKEGKFVFLADKDPKTPRRGQMVDDGVYSKQQLPKGRGKYKVNPAGLPQLADTMARAQGIDPDIYTRLIGTESAFNSKAKSPVGAVGLAQFMPKTLDQVSRKHGYTPEDYYGSESVQLRLGALYLKDLLTETPVVRGSYARALAAYNWGQGNLKALDDGEAKLPEETRNYISKILQVDASQVESLVRTGGGPQYSKMAEHVQMARDQEEFKGVFTEHFANAWKNQILQDPLGDVGEGAKRYIAGLSFGLSELIPGMKIGDEWSSLYNDDIAKNWQEGDVGGMFQNFMLELPRFMGMMVSGELLAAKLGGQGMMFGAEKMVGAPLQIPGIRMFQDWTAKTFAQGSKLGNSPVGALARLGLSGGGASHLDTTFAYAGAFGVQGMMESFSESLLKGEPASEIIPKALFNGWMGAMVGGAFGFGVPFVSGVGSVVLSGAGKAVPEIASHLAVAPPWMRGVAGSVLGATAAQNLAPALGLVQEQDSLAINVGASLVAGAAAMAGPGAFKGVLPVLKTLMPENARNAVYGGFKAFFNAMDERAQTILTGHLWDQLGRGGAAMHQAQREAAFTHTKDMVSAMHKHSTELEGQTSAHIQQLQAKHQELTSGVQQAEALLQNAPYSVTNLDQRIKIHEQAIARAQQVKSSTQDIKLIGDANKQEAQALKELSTLSQDPSYPILDRIKTAQKKAQDLLDEFQQQGEFQHLPEFEQSRLAFAMRKDQYGLLEAFYNDPKIESLAKNYGLDEAMRRKLIDPSDIPKMEAPWNAPNWKGGIPSEESQELFRAMGDSMHRWVTSRNFIPSWGRELDDAVTAQIRALGISTDGLQNAKGSLKEIYERYVQNPTGITPFDSQIKAATSRKGIYQKAAPTSPFQWQGLRTGRAADQTQRWADPKTMLQWIRNSGGDTRFYQQGQKAGVFEEARYKIDQAIEEGKPLKPITVTLRMADDGSIIPVVSEKGMAAMDALVNRGASHVPLQMASAADERLLKRALVGERAKQNRQLRADILQGVRKDLAPVLGASMKELEVMKPAELRQKVIETYQAQNNLPDFMDAEVHYMQMGPDARRGLLYDEAMRQAEAFGDRDLAEIINRQKLLVGADVEQTPETQMFLKDFEEFLGRVDPGVAQALFNQVSHMRNNGLTGKWEDAIGYTKDAFMATTSDRKNAIFKIGKEAEKEFNLQWKSIFKEMPGVKESVVREAFTQAIDSPAGMQKVLTEHPKMARLLDFYLKVQKTITKYNAMTPELASTRAMNELMYRHPNLEKALRDKYFEEKRTYQLVQEISDNFYSAKSADTFAKRRVLTDLGDPSKTEMREQIKGAVLAIPPKFGKTTEERIKKFLSMNLDDRIKALGDVTGGMDAKAAREYAEEKTAYILMKDSVTDPAKLIAGKLYSTFQAQSTHDLVKFMSDMQIVPREGANPVSLLFRKTGEMDSMTTNARFDGKYINHTGQEVGYNELSALPGWEKTSIRAADGSIIPTSEFLIHPDAAKFISDFTAARDAVAHESWTANFSSFVRQTTLFGTPIPHLFNIVTARMSDFVTAPLKAVGLLKAGQKMFKEGLDIGEGRMSPRALELVATRYGLNLRSQDATLKLINEDIRKSAGEMGDSLWAANQSNWSKMFTATDATNPHQADALRDLKGISRIFPTIFGNLSKADYILNRHMLFEPIRMSQLAGFYHTVAENMQRFEKEFAGLPKDVAFRHAASAAATKMNIVHGALPAIWFSDEARKRAYKYLMTPNWAMSKAQMVMSAIEPWLGLTGKKPTGFKGVGAFSHLPPEMRQELGVQFTKMLVAGTFGFVGATQVASYLINGRSTFEQPPDKIFHLQIGGHYYNSPLFGFYRDVAKAFGGAAAERAVEPIIQQFVNQSHPAYKTAIQAMLTKKDDMGRPIYRPEGGGQLLDIMGFIGQNLVNTEDTFGVKPGSNPLQVMGIAADGKRSIQRLNGREWLARQFGVYETDWRVPTQLRADLQSRKMYWQQTLSNKVTELVRAAQETDNSDLAQRYLQDAFMTGLQGIKVDDHYLSPLLPDGRMMMTPEGLRNILIKTYVPEAAAIEGGWSQPEVLLPVLERISKEQELQELGRNRATLYPGR